MNKQKLITSGVLIAVIISFVSVALFETLNNDYVYVPSDITKANPNLKIVPTEISMMTDEISEAKDTVVLTVSGTVTSVGDIVDWNYEGDAHGAVPVTIKVDKKSKHDETKLDLKKGDSFTFYIAGLYHHGQHFIWGFEPEFEINEKVLVHIANDSQGPDGPDGDNYFVQLGKYGKYKIIEDKAYNEKHSNGKSLEKALNEAK